MQSRIVEIPLNKLVHSQFNVRKTNPMVGVEQMAANLAARGGKLIQSLSVRPVLNDAGEETGMYRVPAGGRRLAALKLLAKRKIIGKSELIPCMIGDDDEEELSLSENVMREPLHPADQFDVFKLLSDRGQGAEEIGARYGVTAQVVRQRLRLAAVSPVLMQLYRDGDVTLDQLMAFSVSDDHARQEQVHGQLGLNRQPYAIRRMLTETQAQARDKRAVFVGADAFIEAGGVITRDLFTDDGGGWFSDPVLLDRLVTEKLETAAAELRHAEGWKWTEVSIDYPHTNGLKRLYPKPCDLSDEDQGRFESLSARYDALEAECDGLDDIPDDASDELDALSAEITAIMARKEAFDPEDVARAGVFVVLDHDGALRMECGFVRPEDEVAIEPVQAEHGEIAREQGSVEDQGDGPTKPLSDVLVRELTAYRTMALRFVVGEQPDVAFVAVVHALAIRTFFPAATASCLDLTPTSAGLGSCGLGIEDSVAGRGVNERHARWAARMPGAVAGLWAFVLALDPTERLALLAHCAALTVYAVREPWDRRSRYGVPADTLARAASLDMTAYWKATSASYWSRVTKAQIVDAVRDAVSDEAARRIEKLSKPAMAEAAENLTADLAWLPTPLRLEAPATDQVDGAL